jgi:hypothetical protein
MNLISWMELYRSDGESPMPGACINAVETPNFVHEVYVRLMKRSIEFFKGE